MKRLDFLKNLGIMPLAALSVPLASSVMDVQEGMDLEKLRIRVYDMVKSCCPLISIYTFTHASLDGENQAHHVHEWKVENGILMLNPFYGDVSLNGKVTKSNEKPIWIDMYKFIIEDKHGSGPWLINVALSDVVEIRGVPNKKRRLWQYETRI